MKRLTSVALALSIVGCTTLDQSVRLGAVMGGVTGAVSTYGVQSSSGVTAPPDNVWVGASIGMAIGMITAYFTHQSVVKDRKNVGDNSIIEHGDLPPSPFIFSNPNRK